MTFPLHKILTFISQKVSAVLPFITGNKLYHFTVSSTEREASVRIPWHENVDSGGKNISYMWNWKSRICMNTITVMAKSLDSLQHAYATHQICLFIREINLFAHSKLDSWCPNVYRDCL